MTPLVLPFAQFAEPRLGKARTKGLEGEDSGSHRNSRRNLFSPGSQGSRNTASLLAGAAAVTEPDTAKT